MRKVKKITRFDFIIEKCKESGIEIDVCDTVLKSYIGEFDEHPNITNVNGGLRFISFKHGITKELFISKDGKYTYSFGINTF